MRALRSLLGEPPPYADVTTELGAVRAKVGVSKFFHAYEAAKNFGESLGNGISNKYFFN